jgi:mRNA-degrading endonuclease toxin of MazEF toxin-antitoxin module
MPGAHGARRGDIWIVDLGIAGKVRPAILLTDYPSDDELALVTILPTQPQRVEIDGS